MRRRRNMLKTIGALGAALLCAGVLASCTTVSTADDGPMVLHLVRHAEKELGRDPNLTAAGAARADALVETLVDARIEVIYSTNFKRTRATAEPIARSRNLPIIYYDPSDLDGFASQVTAAGRSALIVGHSNTTPQLVAALGGEAGVPITEATEYDRLYRITLGASVGTEILRYGEATER